MLIIDGHNLIPKVPGLSLSDPDDEQNLIDLLQRYARHRRGAPKRIEVFFDRAPLGRAGVRSYGRLVAHFVQEGKTADEAIRQFVTALGKSARNVTVISSDRQVQAGARELRAAVMSSEDFARQLANLSPTGLPESGLPVEGGSAASPSTPLDEWYQVFQIDPDQADRPIEPPRVEKRSARKPAGKRPHHGFPKKKT